MHFGDSYHTSLDAFPFTFGCVEEETNLFYSQAADGILGMTKGNTNVHMMPIVDAMFDAHIIQQKVFSLCLGKNGGYFQIGGYDETSHLVNKVKWVPLLTNLPLTPGYRIGIRGVEINGHLMAGTHIFDRALVDSGATFTSVPRRLLKIISEHFDWFCMLDLQGHCKGRRIHKDKLYDDIICFNYNEKRFPMGPKDYFVSYPILSFMVPDTEGGMQALEWYPSEYLFRYKYD